MKRILTLAAAAAALACGSTSSNNAATSRNNPGAGSSTLLVQGDINASTTAGAPLTTFSVTVRDGAGNTVGGATVTVLNASLPNGSIALVQATPPTGAYANSVASFPTGDFRLDVVKGTDSVQGVVVGGPGMATINAPVLNSTVTANKDLPVSWTTPAVAKQVTVSTRDMSFSGPDLGAYTIVAGQNPPRASQRVRVDRFNEVEAAGGLVGSRLSVMYRASIDPFTVQ
ncbi:MAG TPA: hypothetical protein VKB92_07250 [Myxococcales bacterium]|nr:hypothetical protein [Myxococcales bacterium]